MTIQQFIEKAIEGGWKRQVFGKCKLPIEIYRNTRLHKAWNVFGNGFFDLGAIVYEDTMLLDPFAWQAVGKVEGWTDTPNPNVRVWLYNWHCMIDALSEGKTIEEFISTL